MEKTRTLEKVTTTYCDSFLQIHLGKVKNTTISSVVMVLVLMLFSACASVDRPYVNPNRLNTQHPVCGRW